MEILMDIILCIISFLNFIFNFMSKDLNRIKISYIWLIITIILLITIIVRVITNKTTDKDKILVKYFDDYIEKIEVTEKGDWYDLRSRVDIEVKKGDFLLIPLGVAMKLPNGYEAHLAPRSSTFKNWGIIQTNSVGVIDNSYSGNNDEWKMPIYATRDTTIHKNDRICQFRVMRKQYKFPIKFVDKLNDTDRGGFGSSGIN